VAATHTRRQQLSIKVDHPCSLPRTRTNDSLLFDGQCGEMNSRANGSEEALFARLPEIVQQRRLRATTNKQHTTDRQSVMSANHCIHCLLPYIKSRGYSLRAKGHPYQLLRCEYELHKKSCIPRCLYRNCNC